MPVRYVNLFIVVGDPDAATECPDCGFDAVLSFPLTSISEMGVGSFGTYTTCARCYDMQANP